MNYNTLISYKSKKELLSNLIWDSRRFFKLDYASKIIRKDDVLVAFFKKRIVFIYHLDLLQIKSGILIGKSNRYSIQEYISDIKITQTSLVWYNNSIHLCLVYST